MCMISHNHFQNDHHMAPIRLNIRRLELSCINMF